CSGLSEEVRPPRSLIRASHGQAPQALTHLVEILGWDRCACTSCPLDPIVPKSPPRRNAVPASHQFNRRIAAIGAALALVALPITGTIEAPPALGQPSPTETANAGKAAAEEAGGSGGADSADATSAADGSDAEAEGNDSGITADDGSSTASSKSEADTDGDNDTGGDGNGPDRACADSDAASDDGPCEIEGKLKAEWDSGTKQLSVTAPNGEAGSLPESWVGESFEGPTDKRDRVRIPVQDSRDSTGDDITRSAANDSDTDD